MNQLIKIGNQEIAVKEFRGQRVVTFKDIDLVHERPDGTADRNFRENKDRLIDGEDYIHVSKSQNNEIRGLEIPNRGITLITEQGYLMLVKSFTDDLAWNVQRQLVDSYFKQDTIHNLPMNYKEALQQLLITVTEKEELETAVKIKDQQIAEMQPKISYYDLVLQSTGLLSMTDIAKDYGKSARWMNEKLHELGIQYFQGGVWFLYQRYAGNGYTKTNTYVYPNSEGVSCGKPHMHWTQKGRLFLYGILKEHGIYPDIEKPTGQLCLVEM